MLNNSPYSAPHIVLSFQGGMKCNVPSPVIKRIPKLASLVNSFSMHISLGHISNGIGHVLVHHLFTGTYQSLKPMGESKYERLVDEFSTSIQVYACARAYEMQSLEELAKIEVDRLGAELPVATVLKLVQDAYPNPDVDDIWVRGYIKSRLRSLIEIQAEQLEHRRIMSDERKTVPIREIVLDGLLELLRETQKTHQTEVTSPGTAAEVPGNMQPTLPESEPTLAQHADGGSEERQLLNTDQLSCEKDVVQVTEVSSGLSPPTKKLNSKARRQAKRELKRRKAEAQAELDLKAETPDPKIGKSGEVNGPSCEFGLKEEIETIAEDEWVYMDSVARSAE